MCKCWRQLPKYPPPPTVSIHQHFATPSPLWSADVINGRPLRRSHWKYLQFYLQTTFSNCCAIVLLIIPCIDLVSDTNKARISWLLVNFFSKHPQRYVAKSKNQQFSVEILKSRNQLHSIYYISFYNLIYREWWLGMSGEKVNHCIRG